MRIGCRTAHKIAITIASCHLKRRRPPADDLSVSGQQETNMSLDNTSHPSVKNCADKVNARYIHGRPESELVPSRYALKVGAIDVMVVSDGVLSLPGAMLGHNVDPAVRAAWLE